MLAAIALVGLTTSSVFAEQPDPQLLKEAKITQGDAQKTALAKVPNGKVKSAELENEGGALVWSFDISKPNSKDIAEVLVDAKTGKMVKMENETPKQQANEAAADKKAKEVARALRPPLCDGLSVAPAQCSARAGSCFSSAFGCSFPGDHCERRICFAARCPAGVAERASARAGFAN